MGQRCFRIDVPAHKRESQSRQLVGNRKCRFLWKTPLGNWLEAAAAGHPC